jgi:uncharacterized protein (DUF488 family)
MNDQVRYHCYTIGHSNHPIEEFIQILKKIQIQCIIDVRTVPSSQYLAQFNRENIQTWFEREGIEYKYLGNLIGGRYSDPVLLDDQGSVDYQKVEQRSIFQTGIDQVCQIINSGKSVALMCSEKDPLDCHRFVLVSKALKKRGVGIDHVLFDGSIISNNDLENKLRELYKSRKDQDIETLYQRRNKEIAFNVHGKPVKTKNEVNRTLDSFFA